MQKYSMQVQGKILHVHAKFLFSKQQIGTAFNKKNPALQQNLNHSRVLLQICKDTDTTKQDLCIYSMDFCFAFRNQ